MAFWLQRLDGFSAYFHFRRTDTIHLPLERKEMNYNVNYFIKKFEAIPEEMWLAGGLGDNGGRRCALGHCHADALSSKATKESSLLMVLLKFRAPEINDGEDERYQQPTPKQRILAALNDVKNETF